MPTFYRHEKRPAWGTGRLIGGQENRLTILFEDGKERTLVADAPGLVPVSPANPPTIKETRSASRTTRQPSAARLIKAARLAVRDAIMAAKSTGAYPDDVMIEMQKGLSRITADYARFLGTRADAVRKVKTDSARQLLKGGPVPIFEQLANRLDEADGDWRYTRAYDDPMEARETLEEIIGYATRADQLSDSEVEEFSQLLTPPDLREGEWDD